MSRVLVAASTFVARAVDGFGLSSLIANNPIRPLQQPTLVGLLGLVRRQFEATLFNRSPTASPLQISQNHDGIVTGTLGAADADGDQLQYTVTQGPANGSVEINTLGSYVYRPSTAFAATGGTDSFIVAVSDNASPRLHLFGDTGVTAVPVTVTVDPNSGAANITARIDRPLGVVLNADGSRAYVVSGTTLVVIDTGTAKVIKTIAIGRNPIGVAVTADGSRAYVTDQASDTVSVVDTVTGKSTRIVVGHEPAGVALSPDGTRLYVANTDSHSVSVISTSTNRIVATFDTFGRPYGVAASPDGSTVYITLVDRRSVAAIDTATERLGSNVFVGGAGPKDIAAGSNGFIYVSNSFDGTVSVINGSNGLKVATIDVGGSPGGLVVSTDGLRVYVTNANTNTVTVIDTVTNQVSGVVYAGSGPVAVAVNASGTRLYAANTRGDSVSVAAINPAELPHVPPRSGVSRAWP